MTAIAWCPFPDREMAMAVAGTLLDEKLIGCANMIDGVQSLFEWNGKRDSGTECGVLFKTDGPLLERLVARIEELHPYDAPAVLGWHCQVAGKAAAQWLGALTPRGEDG